MSQWIISSCYECKLLKDHPTVPGAYWCLGWNRSLSHDVARTVNDCARKQPFDDIDTRTERQKILDQLYEDCCRIADALQGPFTARDLVQYTDYKNKNSLWELLEELVKQKRMCKGKMYLLTRTNRTYKGNVYFPKYKDI